LLQRANQHMQDEQNMMQGWQELQEQSQQDNNNIDMQDEYHPLDEQNEQPPLQQRWQEAEQLSPQQQNHRNSIIKQEKEIEREFERDIDRGQHILEQQLLLQQLQLQEKDKEQQQHEKQQLQRQFHEQEQIQMQQRQEQEQKQIQLQMQLRLQQQHQQQLLLQQQQILQDQQHRQQHIMQQQHHQQLLLQHHFDPDQDDDVLKEAFSYPNIGNLGGSGSTPPLSPTGKTKYSTHPLIGPNSAFSDTNSGVTSLFSGGLNSESRKPEQYKWLYRDPSGNIQ
ncbi:10721_t:CDS:1, partial [Scutellospora calospora]